MKYNQMYLDLLLKVKSGKELTTTDSQKLELLTEYFALRQMEKRVNTCNLIKKKVLKIA